MASRRPNLNASGSSLSSETQPRKRVALDGITTTTSEKKNELLCPVCFELIREAHITKCGHTFCYQCIVKAIETNHRCPYCSSIISSTEQIFPNFLLNELIYKEKLVQKKKYDDQNSSSDLENLKELVSSETKNLSLPDVNVMLEILNQRKQLLEAESCIAQNKILHDFLRRLLEQKEEQKNLITNEIKLIKNDLEEVETILKGIQSNCSKMKDINSLSDSNNKQQSESVLSAKKEIIELIDTIESSSANLEKDEGLNLTEHSPKINHDIIQNRKIRIHKFFDDFVKCYFEARSDDLYLHVNNDDSVPSTSKIRIDDESVASTVVECSNEVKVAMKLPNTTKGLDSFRESLVKFSRYSSLRTLATLNYASDVLNSSTIVSSIEFDKDNEFLAIAGVTKRIKIFDYQTVIRDIVDFHYPCIEMASPSKISCVTWNAYQKSILASSDYEGEVTVWDAETGKSTKSYREHDKRCWSVDFNKVDSRLIASGSDDARVKLWSLNTANSIATLEVKANVCCVKFNPKSSCHVAFGSADHSVHYYDLRNTKEPFCLFNEHKKAVSYVKFLNTNEIVSASTDSRLKLWNINSSSFSLMSYKGHMNEKNFVGLATDGDYITCGSEDNSLYIYYKKLPKSLINLKLTNKYALSSTTDSPEFVSAVCWKNNSNVIVAANSRGVIKILELL